ncbi:pfs domain-containing protein [Hyaloscypha bicolor E]|uniref:Pfs domain-containing protein n=1 Tax=Hyaloscypha bicolor E TaxID=1095630 RepID=A0A2J6SP22_9HELO|nr:pfs domain-containing protein [Hyaloscypha bicolor E]PMD52524.1 pfs domain-containing protein [Hyaloscypha bicolor E]
MISEYCCFLQNRDENVAALDTTDPEERFALKNSELEKFNLLKDEGQNIQEEFWNLIVQEKLFYSKTSEDPFYQEFPNTSTYESSLQALTEYYESNGFSRRLTTVKSILDSMKPFTQAISTMVQSSMVASLVWGSLQIVLQNVMRLASKFEDTSRMLRDLSRSLPRFHAYVEILHTPNLHRALREVYEVYMDFSFAVIKFLRSNKCYAVVHSQWSEVGKKFDQTRERLDASRANFEDEVRLANVQVQAARHREVVMRFGSLSPTTTHHDPISTVNAARNVMFTGREDVLSQLHSLLQPPFEESDVDQGSRRACVIHGIGGMGKTETALEYTYKYRSCYSHIFWLHAQANATLLESLLALVKTLGLGQEVANVDQKVRAGLDWLQSTTDPWLLVFDNAEDASMIGKFWPSGVRGAIILTSQNPDFIQMTGNEILLQPMSPKEGCTLIQRYLRRGGSEQEASEGLSASLGGFPLAISHFAGYVARSQCSIDQISHSLKDRFHSSQIWTVENVASTSAYQHTLATVWDLAWLRLSSDSKELLYQVAFLNPDGIPQDLFIGNDNDSTPQHWDIHRFNEAVRILRERHLIERDETPIGLSLRTHRALQRSILHKLDRDIDTRQLVFTEVVKIVRNPFPRLDPAKRGDPSKWAIYEKYLPQVISLEEAFAQSNPKISDNLEFTTILRDAGSYLMNNGYQPDAVSLLETAVATCNSLLETEPLAAGNVLDGCLSNLQVYNQFMGIAGRRNALKLTARELELRSAQVDGLPRDQYTETDVIKFGRVFVDKGCAHSQMELLEEAGELFDKALEWYEQAGGEKALPARTAQLYACQLWVVAPTQNKTKAQELTQRSLKLASDSVGLENPLTLAAMFSAAMAAFTIGGIAEALQLHKKVHEARIHLRGPAHHDSLASQYQVAVCYQNSNDLESAEHNLRQILELSCITLQWREEDLARTRFRLAVVLRAQGRPSEASRLCGQAKDERKKWESEMVDMIGQREFTDRDDMELFDFGVTLWHGRTTGKWSDGTHW